MSKVKDLGGRYRIKPTENTFMIDKTSQMMASLHVYPTIKRKILKQFVSIKIVVEVFILRSNIHIIYFLLSKAAVRLSSNSGVVEGEKLSIVCTVVSTDPRLSWCFGKYCELLLHQLSRFP